MTVNDEQSVRESDDKWTVDQFDSVLSLYWPIQDEGLHIHVSLLLSFHYASSLCGSPAFTSL